MTFRFHPRARDDLRAIYDYVAMDNPAAAGALIERFQDACQFVSQAPRAGRDRSDFVVGLRSFPVGKYLLLYRILDVGVEIVYIAHGARDLAALLDNDARD